MNRCCAACGAVLPVNADVHPTCDACGVTNWQNPKPVAVLLQPVRRFDSSLGLLTIRRGIAPFAGEWALVGGFIEPGESAEQAALRELREETGLEPAVIAGTTGVLNTKPTPNGQLLIFVRREHMSEAEITEKFRPSAEATDWRVSAPGDRLCFPLHTEAAERFFRSAR
jgi:8-oxo-dGTP diphosphatase